MRTARSLTASRSIPEGGRCAWQGSVRGGGHAWHTPCEQNGWLTGVKTLYFRNFVFNGGGQVWRGGGRGVCEAGCVHGTHAPNPCQQNDWQTGVKWQQKMENFASSLE